MNFYKDLAWEISVNLTLNPEETSVTLQYTFINQSDSNEFYFSLLPSFQGVTLSAIKNDWITIDAKLLENNNPGKVLFSIRDKIHGLRKTDKCFIAIPWSPAGGGIPPKSVLKLDINWVEHGPIIDNKGGINQEWRIHYCLPMKCLFLPLELKGESSDIYLVHPPENIKWQISYPTGINVRDVYFESFKPDYDVKPYVNFPSGTSNPLVEFRVKPNSKKINGRSFSDHLFTLVSQLSAPIDISPDVLNSAKQKIGNHTIQKPIASIVSTTPDESFSDRLINRILQNKTMICVGLDPDLSRFPKTLIEKYRISEQHRRNRNESYYTNLSNCIIEFNKRAIDSVCEYVAAVKPQSAYYERYGHYGIKALYETAIYAKQKGLIVILDAKRNDIDRTAKEYAIAYLGSDTGKNCASIPFDAITVNPYLGIDGIKPFLEVCEENKKGIFVLVKTSNPSSTDFQDLILDGEKVTLAQKVAKHVNEWGHDSIGRHQYSSIGAVVGATHPEAIKTLRKIMPSSIFLMPGYGAQGATAGDIVDSFDENGLGAIISSSSAINYAFPPEAHDFENYIGAKAKKMRDDINNVLSVF